jgi:hypothetical protein
VIEAARLVIRPPVDASSSRCPQNFQPVGQLYEWSPVSGGRLQLAMITGRPRRGTGVPHPAGALTVRLAGRWEYGSTTAARRGRGGDFGASSLPRVA